MVMVDPMALDDLFAPDRILTHSGLRTAGYSPQEIRMARRTGGIVPLVRGSYALGNSYLASSAEHQHLQIARARAIGSPAIVVSHVSAAVFYGLPVPVEALGVVHVTRPGRGGSRRGPTLHQHAAVLGVDDIVEEGGLRVTSVARTLVDLSRMQSFEHAVIAADVALRSHAGLPRELPGVLARARHLPGAGAARRALAFADGRAESPGESRTRIVMLQAGLPTPTLQCEIFDERDSFVGRVDLAIPDCAVLVAFDGMVKYGDLLRGKLTPQQVLIHEKRREDALRELGWIVVRVTWAELADPIRLASRMSAALLRGRRVVELGGVAGTFRVTAPIRIAAA